MHRLCHLRRDLPGGGDLHIPLGSGRQSGRRGFLKERGMAKEINLKQIPMQQVKKFKIRNRKGFAVMCQDNLTEGSTVNQAIERMNKVLKRTGYTIG